MKNTYLLIKDNTHALLGEPFGHPYVNMNVKHGPYIIKLFILFNHETYILFAKKQSNLGLFSNPHAYNKSMVLLTFSWIINLFHIFIYKGLNDHRFDNFFVESIFKMWLKYEWCSDYNVCMIKTR